MQEIYQNSPAQKIKDFQVLRNALISNIKIYKISSFNVKKEILDLKKVTYL
jgi:hypothetical protein